MSFNPYSFAGLINLTRNSTATYHDSTGTLKSAAANVARFDCDPATLLPRGLQIEETRTNLFLYSEQLDNAAWSQTNLASVSPNQVGAPDGNVTADKIIPSTTSAAQHSLSQNFTTVSGQAYALSVYAKKGEYNVIRPSFQSTGFTTTQSASFDLNAGTVTVNSGTPTTFMQALPNGWYRCVIIATATSSTAGVGAFFNAMNNTSNTAFAGDGTSGVYAWGAQLEAGAFQTSYIPTTTAAVTRSADIAYVNTSSSWFNGSEGTIAVSFDVASTAGSMSIVSIDNGASNGYIIYRSSSGSTLFGYFGSKNSSVGTIAANTTVKAALSYSSLGGSISMNGGAAVAIAAGTVATPTQLAIGHNVASNNLMTGHIRSIDYYPKRVPDTVLQTLTT